MSTMGEQLTALRETVASRRGWGPRTIGRLSTRRSLSGAVEWVAVVFVSDEDDQRKALSGAVGRWRDGRRSAIESTHTYSRRERRGMSETKGEGSEATITPKKSECYVGPAFVETQYDVRIRLEISPSYAVWANASFVTLEEATAWRDGVIRGFNATRPLWAMVSGTGRVEAPKAGAK